MSRHPKVNLMQLVRDLRQYDVEVPVPQSEERPVQSVAVPEAGPVVKASQEGQALHKLVLTGVEAEHSRFAGPTGQSMHALPQAPLE